MVIKLLSRDGPLALTANNRNVDIGDIIMSRGCRGIVWHESEVRCRRLKKSHHRVALRKKLSLGTACG